MTISYKDSDGKDQEKMITYPNDEAPITNLVHSENATEFEIKNLPEELDYLEGKVSNREIDYFENIAISYQETKQFSNALGTNVKENNITLTEHVKNNYPTEKTKIAERMYFLNDDNNTNHFAELKNTNLKPVNIFSENKNNYQNNYLQLTDGESIFNQKISTPPLTNKELKEWEKGMTGSEWLETDMNFQIHKSKPHQFIKHTNFYENEEVFEKLQPFEEQINEKTITKNTPSL